MCVQTKGWKMDEIAVLCDCPSMFVSDLWRTTDFSKPLVRQPFSLH